MLNKLLPKSPLGIALTAAAVILYASPEARRVVRKATVKGVSVLMTLTEQIKDSASSFRNGLAETMEEAQGEMMESARLETDNSVTYNTNIEPEDFFKATQPLNVMSDDYLKKQTIETPKNIH